MATKKKKDENVKRTNLQHDPDHPSKAEVRDLGLDAFQTEFDVAIACVNDVLINILKLFLKRPKNKKGRSWLI